MLITRIEKSVPNVPILGAILSLANRVIIEDFPVYVVPMRRTEKREKNGKITIKDERARMKLKRNKEMHTEKKTMQRRNLNSKITGSFSNGNKTFFFSHLTML